MSDSIPASGRERRRPTFIQVCLMVLPIGTIVLGVGAMFWYFQRDYVVGKRDSDALRSKEPEAASVADYLAKLTGSPAGFRGEDTEQGRLGLRATMSLVEGAIGETNMGYNPVVQEFEEEGVVWKNLWADTPGARNPSEIIEVRVPYALADGTRGSAEQSLPVAVALELAHAFAGSKNRRTVRFLFLGGVRREEGATGGGEAYARLMEDRRIKVMGVLDLAGGDFDAARHLDESGKPREASLMAAIDGLRVTIARMANQ